MLKIGCQEMSKYNKNVTMKSEFLIGGGDSYLYPFDENFSNLSYKEMYFYANRNSYGIASLYGLRNP